jgi:hypothetical protein
LDADRFDQLAVSVSQAAPSRRSLLRRVVGGGLATALAALGIGGFGEEHAAAKSCEKRCKQKAKKHDWSAKKRKSCLNKCKQGSTAGGGTGGGAGAACQTSSNCSGGLTCVNNFCVSLSGTGGGGTGGGGTGGGGGGTGGGGGGTGGGGGGGLLGLGGICVLDTECLSAFCNNTVLDVNGKGRCDSCTTVLCGAPNQRRCCGLVQICGPLNVCINL